jgi:hypothetical protein
MNLLLIIDSDKYKLDWVGDKKKITKKNKQNNLRTKKSRKGLAIV